MDRQTRKNLSYLLKHPQICRGLNFSFSQEGEDMIIDNILNFKRDIFYVDFGAYHPFTYSNTLRFYARGGRGLNIDAMPGSMKAFERLRPRDINVESGVSDKDGQMVYYVFDSPGLNSFDPASVKANEKTGFRCIKKIDVDVHTPMYLLDKHVPAGTFIDIMDIDLEGFDDMVIDLIDWEKYHPTIVLTEKKKDDRSTALVINKTLTSNKYNLVACTERTAIYRRLAD